MFPWPSIKRLIMMQKADALKHAAENEKRETKSTPQWKRSPLHLLGVVDEHELGAYEGKDR